VTPDAAVVIRRAEPRDLPQLGRLGALLMRVHYAFDPKRFLPPGSSPEEGYAWFLETLLAEPDALVLVAARDSTIAGYVYAGIEPLSWRELRDRAGFIHDIVVAETERRSGVAHRLIDEAIAWMRTKDVPRVLLWTARQNEGAQRLFADLGFRPTMVEMTRELT